MSATTSTTHDLSQALEQRGVNPTFAASILEALEADVIERTIAWYDEQAGRVGPGVLVAELRSGGRAAEQRRQATLEQQAQYMRAIADWIAEKMPELCQVSPRIIEYERRVYGESAASKLAGWRGAHYAAVRTVMHLHRKHGKGSLTVSEHGSAIRAAVEAWEDRAIEEYGAILTKRTQQQEEEG